MSSLPIEEEMETLQQKEGWIRMVGSLICEASPHIERRSATDGARWASLWLDDLSDLIQETPSRPLKEMIDVAYESSFARCEGLELYPTGAPSLRVTTAAMEAFCFAYGEESDSIRELLMKEG